MRYASESDDLAVSQARAGSNVLALSASEDVEIPPLGRALVHTGIRVALPEGRAGFAVPARAMARERGLMFANAPGLIDTGYRGEVCGIAFNPSRDAPLRIARGEHFMDMVVIRTENGGDVPMAKEAGAQAPLLEVTVLGDGIEAPAYAHADDNGLDLRLAHEVELGPLEHKTARLGIGIALPDGYFAQIQPRSGLSLKKGLSVMGSPVVVDPGEYGRELEVELINLDASSIIRLEKNERVAQLVIMRAEPVVPVRVDTLDDTERGAGGFGSSGS